MPVNAKVMWPMPDWDVALKSTCKIPAGWVACKGTEGTDKMGQFPVHELESCGMGKARLVRTTISIGLHMS